MTLINACYEEIQSSLLNCISSFISESKSVTYYFEITLKQIERYSENGCYFSGVSSFWAILIPEPVTIKIKNPNKEAKLEALLHFYN